ncbi:winged helix-turn-helix transcriptional regulator [Herbaspirillum rhizosphaerae]|uniref:winged helix-turn-helix transcriptional regulator n=1 Tax=Herbaspirillum rhizosphaerae TaxID=346179 RepID=UPI003B846FC2
MSLVGGRWRMLIAHFLLDGPKRFNQLRRDIPNISQRMLTLELRALEESGMVLRTVYPEVPVRVEYALTREGERLKPLLEMLHSFGRWLKARPPREAAESKAAGEQTAHKGVTTRTIKRMTKSAAK